MSTSTANNNRNKKKLELIKKVRKNNKEVKKYQKRLAAATSGLNKALVQQHTDSIELYQELEEKLKRAEDSLDELCKETNGLEDILDLIELSLKAKLPHNKIEQIIATHRQIGKKLNDVYKHPFQNLMSTYLSPYCERGVEEVLALYELALSSVDDNECPAPSFMADFIHDKLEELEAKTSRNQAKHFPEMERPESAESAP